MKEKWKVGDFMTNQIIVANLHNKLSDIMQFFAKHPIKHIPITENEKIIGIVSVTDVLQVLHHKLSTNESVELKKLDFEFEMDHIMTRNPISVQPETLISEALSILQSGDFEALPVTENGKIVGIITNKDLIKIFSKEQNPPHLNYSIENPGFGI